MSRVVAVFLASFAAVALACGAHSNSAVAEPKKPAAGGAPSATSDQPLVPYALDSDADVVRALHEHYTKYEYRIRMRDGVHLHTDAYVPKDASRTWPIMMMRTPYSVAPYGVDNMIDGKNARALRRLAPSFAMLKEGYVWVHQDVRGQHASEGTFVDVRPAGAVDESTDAFDTVDFLVKNVPNNNGRVGVWGISYPGFYAAQAAVNAHPAVKAVSPQAPVTEWFIGDDFHHNGAFMLADAFDFYSNFGKPRPAPTTKSTSYETEHETGDAYDFFLAVGPIANLTKRLDGKIAFWNDLMTHGTRDDFWKARDPRPRYKDAKPAIMTVGGWFDAEDLWGTLETYRAFERGGPKSENVVVLGPWKHGGWARYDGDKVGDISFGAKTSIFYREKIERPFFARHLKGEKGPAAAEAWTFETGTNEWHRYDAWPPAGTKSTTLFFQPKNRLSIAPTNESGAYEYVSDPAKPVPYRAKPSPSIDNDYMTDDQRFAARRTDVVVLSTGPLDADVTLAGPLEASLWVTTTGTDADFVVKLVDVFGQDAEEGMGGFQMLVRAEIMRARFRNSYEKPEALRPGEPTLVRFAIPDANHTFRSGHRIMVQIQSSWFPLADRNPQTFVDIAKATEADFKAATHRILFGADKPSSLKVTLARGTLP